MTARSTLCLRLGAVATSTVEALKAEPLLRTIAEPTGMSAWAPMVARISHSQAFQATSLRATIKICPSCLLPDLRPGCPDGNMERDQSGSGEAETPHHQLP